MRLLRINMFLFLCMLVPITIALQGCGKEHQTSVPDGSTIAINPSTTTIALVADTTVNFSVTVKDKDGAPINKAPLRITGAFAEPRNATNTTARYQFYSFPGGELDPNNIKVDSGFSVETDSFGVYNFSATIYGTVGAVTNSFSDNINIFSGSAFASASLKVN